MIDDVTGYRNTIEYFCKQRIWAIWDIPDPKDNDPARYAFLACLPALLKAAFNARIKMGLVRECPAIISPEEAEAYRNMPEDEKIYEEEPDRVRNVKPLEHTLYMVSHDGAVMSGSDDPRVSDYFKRINFFDVASVYPLHMEQHRVYCASKGADGDFLPLAINVIGHGCQCGPLCLTIQFVVLNTDRSTVVVHLRPGYLKYQLLGL